MISGFRESVMDEVGNIDFSDFYDFTPKSTSANSFFAIGDILDKAADANLGIESPPFVRQMQVYCMVKVRNDKRADAEEDAETLATDVMTALNGTTWSYSLIKRESVGYTIGQFEYQGIRLTLEFHATS